VNTQNLFSSDIDEKTQNEFIKEKNGKKFIVLTQKNISSLLENNKLVFSNITGDIPISLEIDDAFPDIEMQFKDCLEIDLTISNSEIDQLSCTDTNFRSLKIISSIVRNTIAIEGFNDLDPLSINSIIIKETTFQKLRISNSRIDKISIKQALLNNSIIEVQNLITTSLELLGLEGIKEVILNETEIIKGSLKRNKIGKLQLSGLLTSSSTLIVESRIDNLIFTNFMNEGVVYVSNINDVEQKSSVRLNRTKHILQASDSDLGKVHFINCNFFHWFFRFENSSIIDLLVTSSQFPKNADLEWEQTVPNRFENERIVFGQFQKVYEANGDKIKAMYCHRRSLSAYSKDLKQKKDKTSRDYFEIFSLKMNGISNQFEYSALRPLLWMLLFASIFFPWYLFLMGYRPENPIGNCPAIKRWFNLFTNIFEFISPIHKTDFLNDYDLKIVRKATPGASLLDSLTRILFAYLIYQFVQAFRRYGKIK
jgi:hypothetical protein